MTTENKNNAMQNNDMDILKSTISQARKPVNCFVIYVIYTFYVNYFGVVSFFSINMFLLPLLVVILFVWGLAVAVSIRSVAGINARIAKILLGLAIAFLPMLVFELSRDINEFGIQRKFRKYEKQLIQGCELVLKDDFERIAVQRRKYKQFDIWSPGARPTRQFVYHENGIVYIDFNGSPDDGSGVIYNPRNNKIKFHKQNYYHMWGPWYRFNVYYD